ncbi:ABC transporter ATP-binding protein [Vallitalea guaymasensis]|uniref:ABC transporter ATP-binding protein n=1 Tax=Vallitalea guaymasensis TaxID=1185412 RepID=UPI000DE5159F|nr:ABC transporter ATP-binding protein [Vallitalea guaymasensis]
MKQKSWVKTLFSFASRCKGKITISVICAIISVAGGIVPYFGVYKIICLFIDETPTLDKIIFWSIISIAGYLVQVLFYGISTTLSHISAYTILESIRLKIADKLMKAPLGTVLNEQIGNLKNIIVDRVEAIEIPLAHAIPELISNLLLPIGVFIFLCMIDWRMALASMITIPIAGIVLKRMMKTFSKQYDDYMKANNHINSVIVEYVEGIEVIKAFNQSTSSYEKFTKSVDSFKEYTLGWFRSTWKSLNFVGAVLPSTMLGTLPVGILLYLNGSLTPSEFTICLILSMGIVSPLMKFSIFVNDLKSMEYSVRDADMLLTLPELSMKKEPVNLKNYEIQLENVSFSYETTDDTEEKMALSNIDISIPEGSFSALVGSSGGGKSTVARLIARFWDVNEGCIKIGGINIKDIPLNQLGDTITYVAQDNFLFNCSLMENIRLGKPKASDEEVFAAAKAACCDEFISKLEDGYNTNAGVAGKCLSGGEKQRISIARAILKDVPIVILDEATAFTDPENEHKIQKSIAALTKGKTLLVIAHRLSTIKDADQIIVMEKGHIVSNGKQVELLKSCPLYINMWNAHINSKSWTVSTKRKKEA